MFPTLFFFGVSEQYCYKIEQECVVLLKTTKCKINVGNECDLTKSGKEEVVDEVWRSKRYHYT